MHLSGDDTGGDSNDGETRKHDHAGHHLSGARNGRDIAEADRRDGNDRPVNRLGNICKAIILAALQANNWNRLKTAEQLDINRTTLYKKIKQYDLEQYGRTG